MENVTAARVAAAWVAPRMLGRLGGAVQESKMSSANDHCINKPVLKLAWKMRSATAKEMAKKRDKSADSGLDTSVFTQQNSRLNAERPDNYV